jgi:hypothetical protein
VSSYKTVALDICAVIGQSIPEILPRHGWMWLRADMEELHRAITTRGLIQTISDGKKHDRGGEMKVSISQLNLRQIKLQKEGSSF